MPKITDVQPFLMSYVFPQPLQLPFWGGLRTIFKRDAMLIQISTDSSLVGFAPGPSDEQAAHVIRDSIRPFLLGRDPRRFAEFHFPAASNAAAKIYRSVEIALMDAAARAQGVPLSAFLGPRRRSRVRLYGSAGMYMAPAQYAEEAAAIASLGFAAYKMRPALGPDRDLDTVERMRAAVGPSVGLMIDAHAWWRMGDRSYSFDTVAQLTKQIAPFQPLWLEEPLPPDDHAAYRKLRALNLVPIATGEHEQTEERFLDLIDTKAADYIQMDVCCQGGYAMGQRLFQAIAKQRLQFAFHSWGTHLEVLAAAQLAATWPEETVAWLEFPCYSNNGKPGMYPFPLAEDILKEPLHIERGYLHLPDAPGLGIQPNLEVISRYPYQPGPWSIFQITSPPETIAVIGDHSVKWVDSTPRSQRPLP